MSNPILLSDRSLAWVVSSVHPEATIVAARRLHGGVTTPICVITLRVGEEVREVVLRQFEDEEWLRQEPDLVRREAASLERATRTAGVNAPRVIAVDEDGTRSGRPSTLMTRLEGTVDLSPPDLSRWLRGLARTLASLHAAAAEPEAFPWTFKPYSDASRMDYAWSKTPREWQAAIAIVAAGAPAFRQRFIHRDYHPANVLWSGEEVSGVVDWVNGCIGPAGIDVGHCRVNLAQLHGVPAAEEFLAHYRELAGDSFDYDPYWDLVTLIDFADGQVDVYPGWTALGFTGLTDELVKIRLETYLMSLLNKY
ncbi:phosphotransferase family protein [Cohnella sp. GCM10027633]|uniref:phosphotransferase family protein n=1 Tax=unclassified Cohnella TaxID=2636738 RepID=UPI0036393DE1